TALVPSVYARHALNRLLALAVSAREHEVSVVFLCHQHAPVGQERERPRPRERPRYLANLKLALRVHRGSTRLARESGLELGHVWRRGLDRLALGIRPDARLDRLTLAFSFHDPRLLLRLNGLRVRLFATARRNQT